MHCMATPTDTPRNPLSELRCKQRIETLVIMIHETLAATEACCIDVLGSGPPVNGAVVNLHPEVRCHRLEKHVPVEENSARVVCRVSDEGSGFWRIWEIVSGLESSVCSASRCCLCVAALI
ncbi:hypothetical protein TGCOUG_395980 [Toxoplasma gondii COUG]|uniref:Uncharacterized protein n=1 Tax=Toxoplasma gondii COUG TaxID=1074873 RepID=A0A2G8XLY9_TOXGO|nr:hypothetical protein TGCOUG_395980 [Toxoplasma gondii COUG]